MQEEIVSGKKFRRLIDAATDKWQRISFWSKASDCVMEDENGNETTVENEIQNIKDYRKNFLVYNENSDSYQGYINGQWKDVVYAGFNWDGYLLKEGIENKNRNFELISTNYRPNGVTYTRCLYDKNFYTYGGGKNDGISTVQYYRAGTGPYTNQSGAGTLYSLYPIDLTEYSQIEFFASYNCPWGGNITPKNQSAMFYLTRVINDGYIPEAEYDIKSSTTNTISIDCSNLNGSFYFAFYMCETAGSYVQPCIDIRYIRLIK